jgi:hypothetical protein
MTVHTRQELDRIGRLVRREFSHALMSDTKWRKLFTAVDDAGLRPEQVVIKFVEVAEPKRMGFPGRETLHPPRPCIDTVELGPIELRSIEWLLIPAIARIPPGAAKVPPREVEQNIEAIHALALSLGRYPLELCADGLKVVGYRH